MPEIKIASDSSLQGNPMLYGIAMLVVGLLVFIFAGYQVFTWQQMKTWASTEGTITTSHVDERYEGERSKRKYTPVVKYDYTVDGTYYIGETVQAGESICLGDDMCLDFRSSMTSRNNGKGRDYAENAISSYPEGSTVTVYYDASNPDNAVLERDDLSVVVWGIGITGLALLIGGSFFFLTAES